MKHLFFVHGALGAASQLRLLAERFTTDWKVHIINLPGHGPDSCNDVALHIPDMVNYVWQVAEQKGIENFSVFGYSMGGYIAACMASQQPERVEKFITLGTKYHWSQDVAAEQTRFLDPEKIILKTPAFAASLENLHGSAWRSVVNKTAQLMAELGKHPLLQKQDYCKIVAKALVIKGDRDSMVTLPECVDLCSMLPNAGFCILPFTPHPFEKVNQEILYTLASQFFNQG